MDDATAAAEDLEIRVDSTLLNRLTQLGTEGDKAEHTTVGTPIVFTKIQVERLYKNKLLQRVCDAIPESAILKGWEITLGEKANPKIINGMNAYQKELKLATKFKQAQIQANIYGGAVIIMAIDDGRPANEPVNTENIKSVKALYVKDRYKVRPCIEDALDVLDPDHYEYLLAGNVEAEKLQKSFGKQLEKGKNYGYKIHKSRIVRFDGVEWPPDMAAENQGWGGSVLEAVWEDFRDYRTGLKSVGTMLQDFSLFIYSIKNFSKIVGADDEEQLRNRIKFMQLMTSVFGGVAIDAEGEKIEYATRNFGGVDAIIDRQRDAFIGAANIPHDQLFGESPSGLGATGESEERNWSHTVEKFQASRWLEPLRNALRYIFLAADSPTKGKEPPDWGIKFLNMMPESESDKAAARSTQAQTDNTYVTAGVLLPEEIRKSRFGGSEYSFETQLDDKLWEESKQQQDQFGGFGEDAGFGMGTEEGAAPNEEAAPVEEEATLDSLYLDTVKKKSKPTKPGHTWVEDKTVKGGGYWRKLPYREGANSTFTHDGKEYSVDKVLKAVEKQTPANKKIADLEWIIQHGTPDEQRVKNADPSVPIIVTPYKNSYAVVDGYHRLVKAKQMKLEEIPTKTIVLGAKHEKLKRSDSEEPDTPTLIAEAAKAPLGKAVGEWVNALDKWIKGCNSLEEADTQLAQVFDKLKDRKFTQVLEQHNTLAHLAGMAEIVEEDL